MNPLRFLVRQKYRFDIGSGPLSIATFALVASDKLQLLGVSKTRYAILFGFVLGAGGVWLLGLALDRLNYIQLYNREANARNEDLQSIKQQTAPPL